MLTLASNTSSNIGSKKPEKGVLPVEGEIDSVAEVLFLFLFCFVSFSSVSPMGSEKQTRSLCLGKAGVCKNPYSTLGKHWEPPQVA